MLLEGGATVLSGLAALLAAAAASAEGRTAPASFRREVVAVLTRSGCNSGTCHGTPVGKNGFRLSLRGYDPAADHRALTREVGGRRVNPIEAERSLILLKATAAVPHEGGIRFETGSLPYRVLRDWVREGARDDGAESPALVELRVSPAERLFRERPWKEALSVQARFADGSEREVTELVRFSSSDEGVAAVSPSGLVEGKGRGEAAVAAEYLGRVATARFAFVEPPAGPAREGPEPANFIDRQVFAKLELLAIPPSEEATDAEFLRRAFLDAIGLLPTAEEARRFLADPAPGKRARLVDRLLERPEYAQLWGMRYADRLGCNQRFVGIRGAYKYHAWVVEAVAANVPEDRLARAVITSSGGNYSSPPAGFYRRLRDPEAAAESVTQLFLGVRLQCARCHNHPGDRWTQDDYYGMAAFFAGLKFKDGPFFNHLYDKEETVYVDRRAAPLVHPRTGAAVRPRFLGGAEPDLSPGSDRREALAAWLAGPHNPQFARAAANRIWYHLFGRGIVEPLDDFRVSNPPSNDPLLEALAAEFAASGFDRKRLIRAIMTSRTYGLSSRPNRGNEWDEKYFSHARIRLLGAETLLDAISSAAGAPEPLGGLPAGFRAVQLPDGEYYNRFLAAFGRPARAMACECERGGDTTVAQALHLVGGKTVEDKVRADAGRGARLAASAAGPREIVEELFLATLSRSPSSEEEAVLAERIARAPDRRRAVEDSLWALVNHPEFLHQH